MGVALARRTPLRTSTLRSVRARDHEVDVDLVLPGTARGEVVVEVPHAGDVLPLDGPPGMPVTYLARGAPPRGSLLAPAVHAAAARVASPTTYAWMAGESGVVALLRRALGHDGWDRGRVTLRGYWREGVAEG